MSALDHRHPTAARYRRNLRRALVAAAAVHALLFAVVPAYTASAPKTSRDWIRMVDARPWRSREPWPAASAPASLGGAPSSRPTAAPSAPEPVRMESAAPVETTPAPAATAPVSGASNTGGAGGSSTGSAGGSGYGADDGEEPPVFYAYDIAPRVTRKVEPVYPLEAKAQGLEGTVVLHVNLDAGGRIQRAWVARTSAAEPLIRAAMDAVYQFEFEPGRQKDVPVPCTVAIPFEFHLDHVLDAGRKE